VANSIGIWLISLLFISISTNTPSSSPKICLVAYSGKNTKVNQGEIVGIEILGAGLRELAVVNGQNGKSDTISIGKLSAHFR
jgi:hypothetical protein